MRALDRSVEQAIQRRQVSLGVAVVVHLGLFLLGDPRPDAPPPDPVMQVALIQQGTPDADPSPAPPPPPQPAPRQPPRAPPVAPDGTLAAAIEVAPPQPPVPRAQPQPQMSFRDWQRSRPSFLPSRAAAARALGGEDGENAAHRRGKDRCDPPSGRQMERAYLLFDTSGSMSTVLQSQALACAHQYAAGALDRGAEVVVGNFALGSTFSAPTRNITDVEIALRGASDGRATVLPTKELQPFLDQAPTAVSDLVIISDGWFRTHREVLVWYRYFLELNPGNRGTMFTVGSPGHRSGVGSLRDLGFDVHMYEQMSRGDTEGPRPLADP